MAKKRSYKGRTGVILDAICQCGFHPVDIEFGDGYFIFEHGKDMVVHFRVKELKGWKFGIWWNLDGEKQFDFFGQHEKTIDKFKPSASVFVAHDISYYDSLDDMVKELEWYVLDILKFIKRYPYIAQTISALGYGDKLWDIASLSEFSCRIAVYRQRYKEFVFKRVYERMNKRYLKLLDSITYICLVNPKIIDGNKDGWTVCPRYKIVCDDITWAWKQFEPGRHTLFLDEQLPDWLLKKVKRYQRRLKRFLKKDWVVGNYWDLFMGIEIKDELDYYIVRPAGRKK